jgi:hypothetical protein
MSIKITLDYFSDILYNIDNNWITSSIFPNERSALDIALTDLVNIRKQYFILKSEGY